VTLDARLDGYIATLFEAGGTDLVLAVGSPPRMRVDQRMIRIPGSDMIEAEDARAMVLSALQSSGRGDLGDRKEMDFPLNWRSQARLRGNAYYQRGTLAMALRLLPFGIPSMAELGLPEVVTALADRPSGLVLVTGPAGAGKSTTLASVLDQISQRRECHILTIEDPIEYLHRHQAAVVSQREIGTDTDSFADGLRSALREDPDVLMVGEVRDAESAQIVLNMAETGHLVLTTLHTSDTSQAIDRVVNMFPSGQESQVCQQLASCLAGVIYQRLVPRTGGGQVAAVEVLLPTPAVRSLISENKTRQLRNAIVMGRKDGMQTLEDSLSALVGSGAIGYPEATSRSLFPNDIDASPRASSAPAGR
jgi:twitching motility protein PilT